jgi:hypothetical protein
MSNIYELAEQAAEHAVLNPGDEILQSETEDSKVEVPKAFIDKFAELIVRECIEQVWYSREDGINGNISEVIKDRIKEHFGVEE